MNLTEVLVEAREIVEGADLPQEFRSTAFVKAVDYLLRAEGVSQEEPQSGGQPNAGVSNDGLGRAAQSLGVPLSDIEDLAVVEDGVLTLTVPSRRLDSKRARGAKQIAILVAALRQAAKLDDDWTNAEEIRKVCKHYDKFDEGNFGATLASMDDVFQIKGAGVNREVRVKQPGFERAAELITAMSRNES